MARSKLDTAIYATILLAPMVTAVAYIAMTPEAAPIVAAAQPGRVLEATSPCAPTPVLEHSPIVEVVPVEMVEVPEVPASPEDASALPAIPGAGMLLYEGQLVLVTDPDLDWATGRLRSPPNEYGVIASKAVDAAKLPAALAPLVNARVVVYAADGSACTASTGAMTMLGREDGDIFYDAEGAPLDAAGLLALRKDVFTRAQLLLARQSRVADDGRTRRCEGLWARRADLPAPTVFGLRALDPESELALEQQVLEVIDGLPEVASLRAAYEADRAGHYAPDAVPVWSAFLDETLTISRWDEIGGSRSFVNVEVGDGGEACSDSFGEQRLLLFALQGGALVQQPEGGFSRPLAIMDLEGDGSLEFIGDGGTALRGPQEDAVLQRYSFPYHGCGC